MRVKDYFRSLNLLLNVLYADIISFLDTNTRKHLAFVDEVSKIDSISNYELFCSKIREIKKNVAITANKHDKYGRESIRTYGHYKEIIKYAGLDEHRIPYILLQHGIQFNSAPWSKDSNELLSVVSFGCQGVDKRFEIYSVNPWKPVFVFGPYIHYVSEYYDSTKIRQLKEKLGHTLLVFPAHSTENENKEGCNETILFNTVYKKYAVNFDSILVCAYWHDVDSPILDSFEKKGAKLVSAGFRSDPNFIRRLKTIISLSDAVVVDDLGTNIGYCRYLGKPVYLECSAPRLPDDFGFVENFNRFHEAFYSPDMNFTPLQYKQQDELYEYFWGGEKYLRSPEEIRAIIETLKEMCKATHYNIRKMPEYIRTACPKRSAELGYRLLAEAVDPSVWSSP